MDKKSLHTPFNTPQLKVCGMRDPENIGALAALAPAFMGFIFWPQSKRFVSESLPEIPANIKKIGVVVNQSLLEILELIKLYSLQGIQLHGSESPADCETLKNTWKELNPASEQELILIKAFSVGEHFNFSVLEVYEPYCNYFLFDTKGKLPGGNGYGFSWDLLALYPSSTPYLLSGGIGEQSSQKLAAFLKNPASKMCAVIDVNSTFEEPNLSKDIEALSRFKNALEQKFI
jgi:phosphoribosylanthranilate isomerase